MNDRKMGDKNKKQNMNSTEEEHFTFKKQSQFIWMNILLTFRGDFIGSYFGNGTTMNTMNVVNIIQSLIVSVFILLPLMFLQFCIGHISKSGCSSIRRIAPIANGINYSMLIITYTEATICLMDLRYSIYYSIMSVSLPWMNCYEDSRFCIGKKKLWQLYMSSENFENVLGRKFKVEHLSSVQFFRNVLLANEDSTNYEKTIADGVRVMRYISFTIIALVLYLIARVDFHKSITIYCRIGMLAILFLILLCVYFICQNGSSNVIHIIAIAIFKFDAYAQPTAWIKAIMSLFMTSNPSIVSMVFFGSYLKPNTNNELLAFQNWVVMMVFHFFMLIATALMQGVLSNNLGISPTELIVSSGEIVYTLFTVSFSMASTGPELLCCCFFIFITFLIIIRASILLSLIYLTFCDISAHLAVYKHYIISCSALLISSIAIPWIDETSYTLYYESVQRGIFCSSIMILIIETTVCFWIYGVHNLCDDYHFKLGHQPSLFWKINWWVSPFVLTGSLALAVLYYISKLYETPLGILLFVILTTFTPQIITLAITVFQSVKRKEVTHLFLKEETWGDPDPEERKARRLYPPRLQVRYRRRVDKCKHNCLCYFTMLEVLEQREEKARQRCQMDNESEQNKEILPSDNSDDLSD